jgi:hypothetical protein
MFWRHVCELWRAQSGLLLRNHVQRQFAGVQLRFLRALRRGGTTLLLRIQLWKRNHLFKWNLSHLRRRWSALLFWFKLRKRSGVFWRILRFLRREQRALLRVKLRFWLRLS